MIENLIVLISAYNGGYPELHKYNTELTQSDSERCV